jgi:uncharacterized protein YaiE (UPF0345 family)
MNVKGLAMKPLAYNSPTSLNAICLGVEDAKNLSLNLERQGMLTLPASAPVSVNCLEGALWITLDNDSRDIVLSPGEAFTTPGGRRAIVYALKPSRIRVTAAAPVKAPVNDRRASPKVSFAIPTRLSHAAGFEWN